MASELGNQMLSLSISDGYLLFDPSPEQDDIRQGLDDVPPYLFHVHHGESVGNLDHDWVMSMDASAADASAQRDLLACENSKVAETLNKHLRWKKMEAGSANLVSWTSSLLFALRYIFHLHRRGSKDRESVTFPPIPLENMRLCIVRTDGLEKGVFVRDSHLINHYAKYSPPGEDKDLNYFQQLRHSKKGPYYFGEFLSQGALKIKDRCEIVDAKRIVDFGLLSLMPSLDDFSTPGNAWANWVRDHRNSWFQSPPEDFLESNQQAVTKIARLFGKLSAPMAAALICLERRDVDDPKLARVVRGMGNFPTNITQGRWTSEKQNVAREHPAASN